MTDVAVEIDPWNRRGHEAFKRVTTFTVDLGGEDVVMTWDEWMQWQATRDPIAENPEEAESIRERLDREAKQAAEAEREASRGPGIARRPAAKKAAAKKSKP